MYADNYTELPIGAELIITRRKFAFSQKAKKSGFYLLAAELAANPPSHLKDILVKFDPDEKIGFFFSSLVVRYTQNKESDVSSFVKTLNSD